MTEGKGDADKDELVEVFKNGELLVDHTFATIRARSNGEPVETERLRVPRAWSQTRPTEQHPHADRLLQGHTPPSVPTWH